MIYKNSEGYPDPVPGEALDRVTCDELRKKRENREEHEMIRRRQVVYIVSKYAGDVKANMAAAAQYARFAISREYIPIVSHLMYPQILNDDEPHERRIGLLCGHILLSLCDEVWVFGTKYSPGMKGEIAAAKRADKTIRYFNENMEALK